MGVQRFQVFFLLFSLIFPATQEHCYFFWFSFVVCLLNPFEYRRFYVYYCCLFCYWLRFWPKRGKKLISIVFLVIDTIKFVFLVYMWVCSCVLLHIRHYFYVDLVIFGRYQICKCTYILSRPVMSDIYLKKCSFNVPCVLDFLSNCRCCYSLMTNTNTHLTFLEWCLFLYIVFCRFHVKDVHFQWKFSLMCLHFLFW